MPLWTQAIAVPTPMLWILILLSSASIHHTYSMCEGLQQALPTRLLCLSLATLWWAWFCLQDSERLYSWCKATQQMSEEGSGTHIQRSHPQTSLSYPLWDWQTVLLKGPIHVPSREIRVVTQGPHTAGHLLNEESLTGVGGLHRVCTGQSHHQSRKDCFIRNIYSPHAIT